jgi:hypothetical protein
MTSKILIPTESYGVSLEFLMALYTVSPGANTNVVIPVFSGSRMFATIVGIELCPHTKLP